MLKPVKRAFIVLGPEGGGTRLLTHVLVLAGCIGEASHEQRFDNHISGRESPIVWRRAVPHGRANPDLYAMTEQLRKLGYEVIVLVISRNFISTAKSQVAKQLALDEEHAHARIQASMRHITEMVQKASVRAYYLTYESLGVPGTLGAMLRFFGLNSLIDFNWVDSDAKYFAEGTD